MNVDPFGINKMQSQQCDFFRWYDREYTDYQLNYVNALRNEVYELRHERDAALYQAGESSATSPTNVHNLTRIEHVCALQ